MARLAFTLAAAAAAAALVLYMGAQLGMAFDRMAAGRACVVSSAELGEPGTACGRIGGAQ